MNTNFNAASQASTTSPIAVSMGDPAGIGPDIILKSCAALRGKLPLAIYGDTNVFSDRIKRIGLDLKVVEITRPQELTALGCQPNTVFVVPCQPCNSLEPGKANPRNGEAVLDALEKAIDACLSDEASSLVTAPINKKVLYDAGFKHPGHTEFLGAYCVSRGYAASPVMMMASDELLVVPATIHIPLSAVPSTLTFDLLLSTARIVANDLKRLFGVNRPRIAFAGLNPHAGENGSIGREEIEVIAPVIRQLLSDGLDVTGPHSADTMFHKAARENYDAAICMYHDQALIPIKTLSFDEGVNATLGLPLVRTSPDHGTAYDIAGTGKARADSFLSAVALAQRMSKNLAAHGLQLQHGKR